MSGGENPCCEACGRSILVRFPGDLPDAVCESCDADWDRGLDAGHLRDGDGNVWMRSGAGEGQ